MRLGFTIGLIALSVLANCASPITSGKTVFITPPDSAHLSQCSMLGRVQIDAKIMGKWSRAVQIAEIKNRLRDAAATQFPEADTVTHSDMNIVGWGNPDPHIMGIVFKCFK